jgi:hypothetical protein
VLHKDGSSMTVQDDGRGIPVDRHPQTKTSALEVIFTTLHAGGKFEGQSYKTAGGLHGVGASVVNALSRELVATVRRDGATWEQRFRHGTPAGPIKKLGPARGSGTTVFFHPDPTIFPKTQFDAAVVCERLEIASYLHKGLKIVFENEAAEGDQSRREVFPEDSGRAQGHGRARHALCAGPRARGDRSAAGSGAAVDRIDRRACPELRQRHPDGIGRHARERAARRHRQGDPQLHRHAQSLAEGRDAHG